MPLASLRVDENHHKAQINSELSTQSVTLKHISDCYKQLIIHRTYLTSNISNVAPQKIKLSANIVEE